ncbi:glycosyltransferase family 2 protein [Candidatus Gottesmanbacteria bacterium]|nr:glycosyltransferase family 2 protein [Candidatus Gottesmanbacteria bacterium]
MPKINSQPDISVVILNYNTRDLTRTCLTTLLASRLEKYVMEVIVCDNGSEDGSVEMIADEFPGVILIKNGKNLGFAAGNNPGIRKAKGRFVLLLNTDTEIPRDTLRVMIGFMDSNPDAGAATCKLLLPDGSMDPACHRGFPTPWVSLTYLVKLEKLFPKTRLFGEYHQGYKDLASIHEVDCIVGAFFMVRREVISEVGLLDEDYFMYGEDIDWAYRIRKAGWKIMYNPTVTILHKKKQSGRANILATRRVTTEIYFHKYNWLFYKKNYAEKYGPVLTFFVNAFYSLRLFFLEKFGI